jgi:hypothetical protein
LTITLIAIRAMLLFGGDSLGRIAWGLPGVTGLWALGFSVAGYPITRQPANPVCWCLMAAGVAAGVTFVGLGLSDAANSGGHAFWMSSAWVVSMVALSSAIVLFPSGSPPSRWWWAQVCVLWGSGVLTYFADPYETSGYVGLPGQAGPDRRAGGHHLSALSRRRILLAPGALAALRASGTAATQVGGVQRRRGRDDGAGRGDGHR